MSINHVTRILRLMSHAAPRIRPPSRRNATKVRRGLLLSLVQAPSHNEGLMKEGGAENAAVRQQEGKTMSDKLYDIPTDWLSRAYVKDNDYRAMARSV